MAAQYIMVYSELHDRLKHWGSYPLKTKAQKEQYPNAHQADAAGQRSRAHG